MKRGVRSNIILLGIISLLEDLSSGIIIPILPMFITFLGGSGFIVGLIGGLRDAIQSILQIFAGYWSDRIGKRKIFVSFGYFLPPIFKLLMAISKTWQQVVIFSGLERIGKGLRTAPRDAIIAESMPHQRGKWFGIHRAFDITGSILGSIVAFGLVWYLNLGFVPIIFISAAIGILAMLPLFFIKDTKRKPRKITLKFGLKHLPKSLKLFIIASGVFAFANFSYMFFILKSQESFEGKLAIAIPILLYVLFNSFYAGLVIPFGKLSDRIGRRKVILYGYILFALTSLGFVIFSSFEYFVGLFIMYGIANALINSNQSALTADLAPKHLKATAIGTYHTIIGLIALPASLIAGALWQIAPNLTFVYGFCVSLLAIGLFFSYWPYLRS